MVLGASAIRGTILVWLFTEIIEAGQVAADHQVVCESPGTDILELESLADVIRLKAS